MQVTGKTYSLYLSSLSSMLLLLLVAVVGQTSGTYARCFIMCDEDMQSGLTGTTHSLHLSSSSMLQLLLLAVVLGRLLAPMRDVAYGDVVVVGSGIKKIAGTCARCIITYDAGTQPGLTGR